MTDDLVKRLRELSPYVDNEDLAWEAADRIEKLIERVRSVSETLNKIARGDLRLADRKGAMVRYSPADERLVERVRNLECALRSIAETPIGEEIPDRTTIWGLAVHMQETAKDALKEKNND